MFNAIVKYLGFLKHVPLFAWTFDALLRVYGMVFQRSVLFAIEDIEEKVKGWEGITVRMHKYGGIQFDYHKKEIGHIHGNGLLDILVNTKIKHELICQGKAMEHHTFKKSGWISFYIRSEADKKNALELLKYSYSLVRNKN